MSNFSLEKEKYINYAKKMAKQYKLPQDLFLGQLEQESNWNPNAESRTGAKGIGQFQTKWHPLGSWKFKKKEDYYDPYKSIESAAMYMQSLNKQYNGNYMAALAHYNGGTKQGQLVASGKNPSADETANYLPYIQEKAKKYQSNNQQPQAPNQDIPVTAANVAQNTSNPAALTDQKQETIKSIRDYFTNANQQVPEQQPQTPISPYQQDPEAATRIAELESYLSQRKVHDAEMQAQALQHQQMLNQKQQENAKRQALQGLGSSLASFSSPYQSPSVPNMSYLSSQSPMPQAQLSQNNPWQGMRGFN